MKDKVAFVTGAAKGMGEAAVRSFAKAGAAVIIADVDMDAANTLARELTSSGARGRRWRRRLRPLPQLYLQLDPFRHLHHRPAP